MEDRSIFENLSPLDHRYYLANREVFSDLSNYLSERASIEYCIKAEAALLKTHIKLQKDGDEKLMQIADAIVDNITPEEVYAEEEKTQHNIRALVNVIKSKVPKEIRHYVHMGATSVDILDTSDSMKVRDAVRNVVLPLLLDVEELLVDIASKEAGTSQVGRTHGQHAVPITFGFTIAEYVARLGKSIIEVERLSKDLKGKLAGPVGAYNSTSMIATDPFEMEKIYLDFLGLEASEHSTQMVEPEHMLRLLLEINVAFGIIANLADDLRHLQRSEIDELREMFTNTQVGSSTMPQKRNPWNSEHVKSLWKTFAPRVMTLFMDQISEHQRDLSNSASKRFISDYLAGFSAALTRMKKVLATLHVDNQQMKSNLTFTGDFVLAEAAYILLSVGGDSEAHERVRMATLESEKNQTRMVVELKKDTKLWAEISSQLESITGLDAEEFFTNPELYRGKSYEKAVMISDRYRGEVKRLREAL